MIEIHRMHLTDVTPAPQLQWTRPMFPVFAYLVLAPAGPILIDSGVGYGNDFIDELYSPVHHDLDEELSAHGIRAHDIGIVITSHLHFDHCGQNHRFPHAKIFVQRAEVEAAKAEFYTVPEWAFPPTVDLTVMNGNYDVAAGVHVIWTPGHTPGHQSVVIDDGGLRTVVCCQAAWESRSFDALSLGDEGWDEAKGSTSVRMLRALNPNKALFSHDSEPWRSHR